MPRSACSEPGRSPHRGQPDPRAARCRGRAGSARRSPRPPRGSRRTSSTRSRSWQRSSLSHRSPSRSPRPPAGTRRVEIAVDETDLVSVCTLDAGAALGHGRATDRTAQSRDHRFTRSAHRLGVPPPARPRWVGDSRREGRRAAATSAPGRGPGVPGSLVASAIVADVRGPGALVISLDFELHWGMRDHTAVDPGVTRTLTASRSSVTTLADLFARREVRATWATVGLLFAADGRRGACAQPDHPARLPRGAPRPLSRGDRPHRGRRPHPPRWLAGGPAGHGPGAGAGVAHLLPLLLPRTGPRRRRLPGGPRRPDGCSWPRPAAPVPGAPPEPMEPGAGSGAGRHGLRVLPGTPTRLGPPVATGRRLGPRRASRPAGLHLGRAGRTHLRLGRSDGALGALQRPGPNSLRW